MLITDRATFDLEDLRCRLYGDVFGPADAGWDTARAAWNLAVDQRPAAVAFPFTDSDVVAVVDFAREHGLRVAPQGTGHGAAAIASLDGTILLSTARMRGVRIDPAGRRARVRAGALWEDVTGPASGYGLAPLAGSSPDVGVVGYTLGGGLSWLGRRYGQARDSVTALDVVTADGRHVRTDATREPELFAAMLGGGGGSFGIVTAMEFMLYPVDALHGGALMWPVERAREIFAAWRAWTDTVPDEVTSLCRVLQLPPLPDLPPFLRGRSFVVVEAAILGGDDVLAPLRALGPELDMVSAMPPAALVKIHNDPEQPVPAMGDHRLLADLDADAIATLVANATPPLLSVEVRHLGGALAAIPARYSLFSVGMVMGAESAMALDVALGTLMGAMAPWDSGRSLPNFADRPTPAERVYGDDLDRLKGLRAELDPEELFLATHPV